MSEDKYVPSEELTLVPMELGKRIVALEKEVKSLRGMVFLAMKKKKNV